MAPATGPEAKRGSARAESSSLPVANSSEPVAYSPGRAGRSSERAGRRTGPVRNMTRRRRISWRGGRVDRGRLHVDCRRRIVIPRRIIIRIRRVIRIAVVRIGIIWIGPIRRNPDSDPHADPHSAAMRQCRSAHERPTTPPPKRRSMLASWTTPFLFPDSISLDAAANRGGIIATTGELSQDGIPHAIRISSRPVSPSRYRITIDRRRNRA